MRYLLRLFLVSCIAMPVHAQQTQTTPNLITPSGTAWGIPQTQILDSAGIGSVEGAGYTTGTAYYNSDTNTIRFGYLPSTVAQTMAINQALSGTGISVVGFNWYYLWMNGGYNSGTLTSSITVTNSSKDVIESKTSNHPMQPTDTWNAESGTHTFTNPYALSSLGNISITFSGSDNRFWMGLYGPKVRDPGLSLNYTVDICTQNPLSSPTCAGYAAAYFTQQCSLSALYNPACPGYAVAYHDQQCTIDPLYMSDCPGYASAYAKKYLTTTAFATTESVTETTSIKTDPIGVATTSTTTSTTSPTSVISPISVISGGTTNATTITTVTSNTVQSTATAPAAAPTADTKASSAEIKSTTAGSSTNESAKSRVEARAKEVVKASSEAKTLEAQTATQGLVVNLIAFVPGFDVYASARIFDINALEMQRKYSQPVVDNRSALRQLGGASDQLHRDMIDQQYR